MRVRSRAIERLWPVRLNSTKPLQDKDLRTYSDLAVSTIRGIVDGLRSNFVSKKAV